jgi:hypothetical protein
VVLEPARPASRANPAYLPAASEHVTGGVTFTDAHGVTWTVCEADCGHTPGARKPMCLIFTSAMSCRRVYTYDSDWAGLPTDGLIALSQGR